MLQFGTDGIRGIIHHDIDINLLIRFVVSIDIFLSDYYSGKKVRSYKILIGEDTRYSSKHLSSLLTGLFTYRGYDIYNASVITTPALASLIDTYDCELGIVISASHNAYYYNGIKIFLSGGVKLSIDHEEDINRLIKIVDINNPVKNSTVGVVHDISEDITGWYKLNILSVINKLFIYDNNKPFNKLKVIVDCSNGASVIFKSILDELNCNIQYINCHPNGYNINQNCGSVDTNNLKLYVLKDKADIGIAYDGDGDRCIIIDSEGNELDGDYIIYILSYFFKKNNLFKDNYNVVMTCLSNIGIIDSLNNLNIQVHKTLDVGDKYVSILMQKENALIGGEQSGHIIFKDNKYIGDGLLTSYLLLLYLSQYNLRDICNSIKQVPRVNDNVVILKSDHDIKYQLSDMLNEYVDNQYFENKNIDKDKIIINIRASGTENKIRIFCQGYESSTIIKKIVNEIKNKANILLNNNFS